MSRFSATLKMDFKLQYRYGFYYAAAFVTIVWLAILAIFPAAFLDIAVPFIIFADLGIVGFFFIAGQNIFEKNERTIYALVTTPQTFAEYAWGKLTTLTFLAWIISIIVVTAYYGTNYNMFLLTAGVILTSLIALSIGLIAVAPYQSISAFIMPSQLYFLPMNIPLLNYFGWLHNWALYLIPTQGSLLLLKSAFVPVETWQLIYAITYQVIWVGILLHIARQRFEKYIVGQKGVRS